MNNKERFTIRVAVYLFLIKDNKILLIRRANTGYHDGEYSTPAGHIDGNESITQAMIREAKEEIGITIQSEDLDVFHVMHDKSDHEYICFFLKAKQWIGEPRIMEPDKCDDLQWFELDHLPKNVSDRVLIALENYQKGTFFSEMDWN